MLDGGGVQRDVIVTQTQAFEPMHGADVFRQLRQVASVGAEFAQVGEIFQQAIRLGGKQCVIEFQDGDLVQKPFQLRSFRPFGLQIYRKQLPRQIQRIAMEFGTAAELGILSFETGE
ncbi:hypothetical protein D3C72_619350 [compost metagenome]